MIVQARRREDIPRHSDAFGRAAKIVLPRRPRLHRRAVCHGEYVMPSVALPRALRPEAQDRRAAGP